MKDDETLSEALPVTIEIGIKGPYIVMNIHGNDVVGPSHIAWTVKEAREVAALITKVCNLADKN